MVFDICALSQKCLKVQRVTMKHNDVVERHDTQRRMRRVTIPYNLFFVRN